MEKNIFENAYFGKAYKTIGVDKVIVIEIFDDCVCLALENLGSHLLYYYKNGVKIGENSLGHMNIDSEWTEEINEKELDKLAEESAKELYTGFIQTIGIWIYGFKEGYRKALNN